MEHCPLNHFYTPAQRQRYLAAIPGRYSCRSFSAPPDVPALAALNYAAQRVCLPGTRILIAECGDELFHNMPLVGAIRGATRYAAILTSAAPPRARLLAGVSGEAFVLEAAAMGVGTCWLGFYRKKALNISPFPGESVAAIIALGMPESPKAQVVRKRKSLAQLCVGDPAAWPLWAYQAAEAVRQAPSAMNAQPWKLAYARRSLQLLGRSPNRLDFGIALMHMEAAAGDKRRLWQWGQGHVIAHLVAEDAP